MPIPLQPWWLDAVCGPTGWDVVIATDKAGRVEAVLPYHIRRYWGILPYITLPPLTTYAGPWWLYPSQAGFKRHSRYAFEKHVCGQLIAQLPQCWYFTQHFHPDIQNWYAFFLKGFRQTTRYTYILEPLEHLGTYYQNLKGSVRSDLKKAAKNVQIEREDFQAPPIFALYSSILPRKGRKAPCLPTVFERLHKVLQDKAQSVCFTARGKHMGELCGGLYLCFDNRAASVLFCAVEPHWQHTCALHALFWEAVQWAGSKGLRLDFEGSMDAGLEAVFRSFGGQMVPYFSVWKAFVFWN